ncbi:aminoglycoside phosphotransferase [Occultella glacieicola]|uniref:Aminoglycoside phosphotransferase n=1 Tax=Occultella glacieicola TaxID=2518684 RepID=A0ABY2E423_9MICO|nr:phosphotransferase [Occultella glacieicola]TDE94775.1 aminoglycoside phosphotransferase [Occultella glacieicola]
MAEEQVLTGGNVSTVVRVGDTVRKPWTAATPHVHAFMGAVRGAGVDVPQTLGRDDRGRQVLEYVPGRPALDSDPLTLAELSRVGLLVRAIHDAGAAFRPSPDAHWDAVIPAPGDDVICHNDLTPWNLLLGERWTFIDWDGAGPSTRVWDLAYTAQSFTLSDTTQPPAEAARRLLALIDGYGADVAMRSGLATTLAPRTAAMYELLETSHRSGRQPWAAMFTSGHGDHWRAVHRYVERHEEAWTGALTGTPG